MKDMKGCQIPSYSLRAMRLAIIIAAHLSTPITAACALARDRQGRGNNRQLTAPVQNGRAGGQ